MTRINCIIIIKYFIIIKTKGLYSGNNNHNNMNGRFKCKHCGYEWWSRVEKPKSCPMCKQYKKAELLLLDS